MSKRRLIRLLVCGVWLSAAMGAQATEGIEAGEIFILQQPDPEAAWGLRLGSHYSKLLSNPFVNTYSAGFQIGFWRHESFGFHISQEWGFGGNNGVTTALKNALDDADFSLSTETLKHRTRIFIDFRLVRGLANFLERSVRPFELSIHFFEGNFKIQEHAQWRQEVGFRFNAPAAVTRSWYVGPYFETAFANSRQSKVLKELSFEIGLGVEKRFAL